MLSLQCDEKWQLTCHCGEEYVVVCDPELIAEFAAESVADEFCWAEVTAEVEHLRRGSNARSLPFRLTHTVLHIDQLQS